MMLRTLAFFQGWRLVDGAVPGASPCAAELAAWLYDDARWAPPGYHALCVVPGTPESRGGSSPARHVEVWTGGHAGASPKVWAFGASGSLASFRLDVQKRTGMKRQRRWRVLPWALYDTLGGRVRDVEQLSGVLLVFEGGRWVWPGIREGFERSVQLSAPQGPALTVKLRTLTLDPLAFTVDGFVNSTAARHIVDLARPRFRRSGVEVPGGGAPADMAEARTCSEAWVDPKEDGHLEEVARRTAALTRVPRRLQEDFRMLEYKPGQQFVAHTDYYEVEDFKQHPQISSELKHGRNWLVTLYAYLSTVKKGGETYFPSTYGKPLPVNLSQCDGPSVAPRRGRALLFYSLHPDSRPNLSSMHGGCKVVRGVKYTINIWTFNQLKGLTKPDAEDREPEEPVDASKGLEL
uniref:Prolyl 4-hydroxylase alpha subunit domain-containing protein n=1 Tax=Pyrodinium bahamense TaxID=73915 RepID=A0A7S0AB81_9DINO|mmetsp:Transcript_29523/g.81099  ORF Transcript_29523/g.81099 Transcript_29523/m.81099 type:complete len:406 (+) Transcript_29523:126-1343(+)